MRKLSIDTSELSNEDRIYCFLQRSMPPPCICLSDLFGAVSPAGKEESTSGSEIKNTSVFLLAIVTNESNVFQTELILRQGKINLFKCLRQMFLRTFYGFTIGCPDDVNVRLNQQKYLIHLKQEIPNLLNYLQIHLQIPLQS